MQNVYPLTVRNAIASTNIPDLKSYVTSKTFDRYSERKFYLTRTLGAYLISIKPLQYRNVP